MIAEPTNPLAGAIAVFAVGTLVVGLVGTAIAGVADRLADRTGLGEAVMGAVFVGAVTSLPGSLVSITAAADGRASLAISNGLGGIAAQTAFLVAADIAYRKANLEHAAATAESLMQGALLTSLLGFVLVAAFAPDVSILGVSPASVILVAAYWGGIRLVARSHRRPMWHPRKTPDTHPDRPDAAPPGEGSVTGLVLRFAGYAAILALAGWALGRSAIAIVDMTGLSETTFGATLAAIATSTPELVIAIGAVRRGALTLALGEILGGNCFDVLFVAFADVAYRDGSIYGALGRADHYVIALTVLMTGILLLGLLHRQKRGPANIGFESALILSAYCGSVALMAATG